MNTGTLSSQKLLDIEHGLVMMGSAAVLRKILGSVNVSLTGCIAEIRQALAVADIQTTQRLLHDMKGYAPIFCSEALIEQLTQVEARSKTETAAVMQPLFAELALQLEALLVEIRAYIAEGDGA